MPNKQQQELTITSKTGFAANVLVSESFASASGVCSSDGNSSGFIVFDYFIIVDKGGRGVNDQPGLFAASSCFFCHFFLSPVRRRSMAGAYRPGFCVKGVWVSLVDIKRSSIPGFKFSCACACPSLLHWRGCQRWRLRPRGTCR